MKRFGLLRLSARRWSVMEFVGMSRTEDGVDYESWFNMATLANGAEAIDLIRRLSLESLPTEITKDDSNGHD